MIPESPDSPAQVWNMNLSDQTQRRALGFIFLALLVASILYGTTYQQFRHYDLTDPRGIADIHGYLEMAHGNFGVDPPHRYRPIVPWLASAVSTIIDPPAGARTSADALSFYIVNFLFIVAGALFLFYFLIKVTDSVFLSFLGLVFFLSSRHTIIAGATPIIDSFYLCSIAAFAWLVVTRRVVLLALSLPLMAWSKETMVPLLFLPLLARDFRRWEFGLGLAAALVGLWALRLFIGEIYGAQIEHYEATAYVGDVTTSIGQSRTSGFFQIIEVAWNGLNALWPDIITLRWWHSFQNGFALVLPLAAAGLFIYFRRKESNILLPIIMLIPVALVYQLVNQAGGRMLFTGFPAIIAFALIAVREIMQRVSYRTHA
jgi:hypothetical protein